MISSQGEEIWAAIEVLGYRLLRDYGPPIYRHDLEIQETAFSNDDELYQDMQYKENLKEFVNTKPHQMSTLHGEKDGVIQTDIYRPIPAFRYNVRSSDTLDKKT